MQRRLAIPDSTVQAAQPPGLALTQALLATVRRRVVAVDADRFRAKYGSFSWRLASAGQLLVLPGYYCSCACSCACQTIRGADDASAKRHCRPSALAKQRRHQLQHKRSRKYQQQKQQHHQQCSQHRLVVASSTTAVASSSSKAPASPSSTPLKYSQAQITDTFPLKKQRKLQDAAAAATNGCGESGGKLA